MSQLHDPSDIPDAIALRIGRFLAKCSGIDVVLQAIIWRLTRLTREEGRLLTGRLDARPKVEIIDSLMDLRQPPGGICCSWDDIRKNIPQLLEVRNWLAHGAWTVTPLGEYALLGTRKIH